MDTTAHLGEHVIVLYADEGGVGLDIDTLTAHQGFDTWEELLEAKAFDGKTLEEILPDLDVEEW